ncbi:uncharacterized protein LOC121107904 isoform X3 [Gallus gallus]|uniref:uncharacterized protein LOC121107923 isoform X2 n=1 Tax=Gallus gallus TaxID=9031 RepID=UPI001AE10D2F|nr:uncharacterized protein LOC121107923 isoform X2 [Gallus gallus]XP_040550492.1 uncharacterized protein LOC121107904 isoform X3 [Gallus gallus]
MGCITVSHSHIKVDAVRRDLQKMLGEAQWTMACPRVPALLLLVVVGTGVNTWDICSSRTDGTLQAPLLVLKTSRAQEGEVVLAQCVLQKMVPAARIVLCKDGMEVYSMEAHQHTVINSMLLNISARSSGTYVCHVSRSTEGTAHADPYTPLGPIVIAVASVAVTLLLSAASCWIIKKGACGKRCCSAEGAPADHDLYYVNVDEMRRVKVRCALAEACRLSVHFFVCRRHGFGGEMPAQLSRWRCSGCSSPPATFPWGMLHGRAVGPL